MQPRCEHYVGFDMTGHGVCPWWIGWLLASPIRRLQQDPVRIIAPYVRVGMTVLEPGPGMGFFTLPLARAVGDSGRVIALDVQPRMIAGLKRRAARAHLLGRIDARVVKSTSLALDDFRSVVDFVLAFAVVHEMPNADAFFAETAVSMKPGARTLLAEPSGHVGSQQFAAELDAARRSGLVPVDHPSIARSSAALLQKATAR